MENLSPLDHPVLFVAAVGFLSGAFIALQEITLTGLINKQWESWGSALAKVAFSTLGLSALFGLGAFILTAGGADSPIHMPPADTVYFFTKIGIVIAIITPLSGQLNKFLSERQTKTD
ncbi:MAG: hypothetical protein AAGJ69_05930 [Cyanobacteria bacterium J06559_1]